MFSFGGEDACREFGMASCDVQHRRGVFVVAMCEGRETVMCDCCMTEMSVMWGGKLPFLWFVADKWQTNGRRDRGMWQKRVVGTMFVLLLGVVRHQAY